jgi:hypothetical protein
MGRTSAPRRRVAVLSTGIRRWSRRGREVLLGKQDLPKSATAPPINPSLAEQLYRQDEYGILRHAVVIGSNATPAYSPIRSRPFLEIHRCRVNALLFPELLDPYF